MAKEAIANAKKRRCRVIVKWLEGHAGDAGNEKADKLAKEGTGNEPDKPKIQSHYFQMRKAKELRNAGLENVGPVWELENAKFKIAS